MTCILPEFVATVFTILVIVGGALPAYGVIELADRIAWKRHPMITISEHQSRSMWRAVGVLVAVMAVFPVTGWSIASIARPALCEAVGEVVPYR